MSPTQRQLPPHMDVSASSSLMDSPSDTTKDAEEENVFRDMSFDEVLEHLNTRFLVNLPPEETSLVRVYWQAEQAHWFYEDYLRPLNPLLPSLSQRQFTHLLIASSPLYAQSDIDYDAVWEEYWAYKRMVPVCGAIMVNFQGDKVLMVRGWKNNSAWSFPRGKINSQESEVACAIREVEEETGFDLTGLVQEHEFVKTQINAQDVTLFLVKDIDESTTFETQTRNEIGAIEWVPIVDLPTWASKRGPKTTGSKGEKKFYNVTPFVGPLKKWLAKRGVHPQAKPKRRRDARAVSATDSSGDSATASKLETAHTNACTALDHLFAKFIVKDDNVLKLESENARKLDSLFAPVNDRGPHNVTPPQGIASYSCLYTSLGAGTQTPPRSNPEKLLSLLGSKLPSSPTSPTKPGHQTKLLSLLSPTKAAAPLAPVPPAPFDHDEARRERQRAALLESMIATPSASQPIGQHDYIAREPTPPPIIPNFKRNLKHAAKEKTPQSQQHIIPRQVSRSQPPQRPPYAPQQALVYPGGQSYPPLSNGGVSYRQAALLGTLFGSATTNNQMRLRGVIASQPGSDRVTTSGLPGQPGQIYSTPHHHHGPHPTAPPHFQPSPYFRPVHFPPQYPAQPFPPTGQYAGHPAGPHAPTGPSCVGLMRS